MKTQVTSKIKHIAILTLVLPLSVATAHAQQT